MDFYSIAMTTLAVSFSIIALTLIIIRIVKKQVLNELKKEGIERFAFSFFLFLFGLV